MSNALTTGVAGLLAHQRMLDVTGNNLANINTTAYKSQRVLFADTYYQTLRSASSSSAGGVGGVNPSQVGTGVIVSQIDRNFRQSSLELTGGQFDVAIEGDGFFVINDGTNNLLTRAGSFGLDSDQMLVDQATGFRVVRIGAVGESDGVDPGFQVRGSSAIRVPLGATMLGVATQSIGVTGNLNATAQGPTVAVLTSASPFLEAGGVPTLTTLLNNLNSNSVPYQAGDSLVLSGTNPNGSAVSVTIPVNASTTMGDLINAINSNFQGVAAEMDSAGNLRVVADQAGSSQIAISIEDDPSNTGQSAFEDHLMLTTTLGTDGTIVRTPVEFFDASGRSLVVLVQFQKLAENHSWNVTAEMDPADGALVLQDLGTVRFNDDGSFRDILGSTSRSIPVSIVTSGQSTVQTINLGLGSVDGFAGLTQTANDSATLASSDGYASGQLYTATIQQDGTLVGLGTNGRQVVLAQLGIASVVNNGGLHSVGGNQFTATVNSGQVQLGRAATGSRGRVVSGYLEASNVDLAYEFTRLIVAQRGFSANARSITIADEMIREVTNIIR